MIDFSHIENMKKYGVNIVVALNKFLTDSDEEIKFVKDYCQNLGVDTAISEVFSKGGDGGIELAKKVVTACDKKSDFKFLYDIENNIKDKISNIAINIYGAKDVLYTKEAEKSIKEIESLNRDKLPVCIAKTQYSFSDDPSLLGSPKGFSITVRDVKLSNGAGFIVVYLGNIMTMPGLPSVPAANNIDIDSDGMISGLF